MGVVPIVNENDTVSVSVSALISISYNGTPLADLVMLRTGPHANGHCTPLPRALAH